MRRLSFFSFIMFSRLDIQLYLDLFTFFQRGDMISQMVRNLSKNRKLEHEAQKRKIIVKTSSHQQSNYHQGNYVHYSLNVFVWLKLNHHLRRFSHTTISRKECLTSAFFWSWIMKSSNSSWSPNRPPLLSWWLAEVDNLDNLSANWLRSTYRMYSFKQFLKSNPCSFSRNPIPIFVVRVDFGSFIRNT